MASKTPTRKPAASTKAKRRPGDPTGRVDILLLRLAEEFGTRAANPVLRATIQEVTPILAPLVTKYLGPRTKRARQLRECIERGNAILRAQFEARARAQAQNTMRGAA